MPVRVIHPCAAAARDDASAGRSMTSNVSICAEHFARSQSKVDGQSSYDLGKPIASAQSPPPRHKAARAARALVEAAAGWGGRPSDK